MDNFEYLNQIAQSTKPQPKPSRLRSMLSGSSIMKFLACGLVIFVLLLGLSIISSNTSKKTRELREQIVTRATNLNATLQTYGPRLKSSQLRSINSSLSSALSDGLTQMENYNKSKESEQKKKKSKKKDKKEQKAAEEEEQIKNELDTSLQNARLNGLLDRVYANQINLQVSRLTSIISQLNTRTHDEALKSILEQFYSNLNVIHANFENFVDLGS